MGNTLVRVYEHLADAEQVRQQLLGKGFSESSVHLTATGDEAGAVQGNFVVDRKEDMNPDSGSFLDRLHGTDPDEGDDISRRPDTSAPQQVVYRGNIVLTVDAETDEQENQASSILARSGAVDIDELVYRRNREG